MLKHYKDIIKLGTPIMVGNIGTIVLNFADTLMIGRHSTEELAAASFINTLFIILILFATGFSIGLTPMVGYLFGVDRHDKIGGVVRQALVAATFLSLLLILMAIGFYFIIPSLGQPEVLIGLMRPYLIVNIISLPFVCWACTYKQFFDTISRTKISMMVLVTGNILNIVGNYLLIYGKCGLPELGLMGAGLSTLFSRIVMALLFFLIFFRKQEFVIYKSHFFDVVKWKKKLYFRLLNKLGWPSAMQVATECAAFSLTAIFVGWMGVSALAAHQIMLTVSQLFFMVYLGFCTASGVLVSHYYGSGDIVSLRRCCWACFHLALFESTIVGVPIFIFRDEIGWIFSADAEVVSIVAATVIPMMFYQLGDALQCTFANALRGLGEMRSLMVAAVISYFFVSLPLSWLFGIYFEWGIVGIWSAFPVALSLAGLIYYVLYRRKLARI